MALGFDLPIHETVGLSGYAIISNFPKENVFARKGQNPVHSRTSNHESNGEKGHAPRRRIMAF